ncbi:MAG: hypothetical protein R3D60_04420 [Paracoccaceae bacterium]
MMDLAMNALFLSARRFAALCLLPVLAACANGAELGEERPELADFRLCYNIVTTNDAVQGPLSREADLDLFAEILREEIERRFGRYEGQRLYHLAMHIDAYVLAVPGVPIVASPRSALIASLNVWDDALGRPLNDEPEQFTVLESVSGSSIVGSGLTMSAEQQMRVLAQNAALRFEQWMVENPDWFPLPEPDPAADVEEAETPAEGTPAASSEAADEAATTPEGAEAGSGCGRH